jgi:hypothetical protein
MTLDFNPGVVVTEKAIQDVMVRVEYRPAQSKSKRSTRTKHRKPDQAG